MNEDAFARRFYADRSELEALGIRWRSRSRSTGWSSRRTTRCPRRTSTCPRSPSPTRSWRRCARRCSCWTASSPTPSRCGWRCSRSPGAGPARSALRSRTRSRSGSPAPRAATRCPSAWPRSRPRSSAARRSCSTTTRWSATRSAPRRVDPYQLLYQGGQFYVVGRSHERSAIRVFRLSRIRGKVGYATKAEHDFQRPANFDPRAYANRIHWQFGDPVGTAEVWISQRIAWQIERHFGRYGEIRPADGDDGDGGDRLFVTAVCQLPPADRLGARPRRERPDHRAARARRRTARPDRVW